MPFVNDRGEQVDLVPDAPAHPIDENNLSRDDLVTIENIAQLGWQAHREWESIIGEQPKPAWDALTPAQQNDICDGVRYILEHPTVSVRVQHDYWRGRMAMDGWCYGETKNGAAMQHPNMIEFDALPFAQQMKARLWRHIVHAVVG